MINDEELSNNGRGPDLDGWGLGPRLNDTKDDKESWRRWVPFEPVSEPADVSDRVGEMIESRGSGSILSLTGAKYAGRAGGEYAAERSTAGSDCLR